MNFVISSSTLSTRLNTIGRVITQKNTMPILDCFCMNIQGQQLTIIASDGDSFVSAHLELNECDADVRFAVNAKTLQDAIKEIPEQPLVFSLDTNSFDLTVSYQNGQYKLMAQSAEDYPLPAALKSQSVKLTMDAQRLTTGVSRALVAAATDTYRPQLNAVCFDVKDHSLSLVGCNGNQLALTQLEGAEASADGVFLLNTRPSNLLKNILAKEQGDVKITFSDNGATFVSENYHINFRLVEGRYPNYRSIIPMSNSNVVTINRMAFISVLRRVLVFANPSAVLVRFNLDNNSMRISSQDSDFGKSADELMLCEYEGAPMHIAFKGSILLELIQNIEAEEIAIKLADPSRAGLISPVQQKENENILMLIMPSVFNE